MFVFFLQHFLLWLLKGFFELLLLFKKRKNPIFIKPPEGISPDTFSPPLAQAICYNSLAISLFRFVKFLPVLPCFLPYKT